MNGYFDLNKPTPEIIGLFFDANINRFIDEDGCVVHDIFRIITPDDLFLFKQEEKCMVVDHAEFKEVLVELFYLEDEWEESHHA